MPPNNILESTVEHIVNSEKAKANVEEPLSLKNHQTSQVVQDKLHKKAVCPFRSQTRCTEKVCKGSTVFQEVKENEPPRRPLSEIKEQAKQFLDEYYNSLKGLNSDAHLSRWGEVLEQLDLKGTYELTENELSFGTKLAWRNASRCIGRIQWNRLQVFDCRNVKTATDMFEAICKHLEFATNNGNLRSAITVFPQRNDPNFDFRVWNQQLIAYAAYELDDGTIVGDPVNVEFTQVCQRLGWKSEIGQWNILPLVLSANGQKPEVFEIPKELVLVVPISHPKFDWFAELGCQWFGLPAVSGMLFDCGGIEFPACPFNGWYMGTEIGCRDLGDSHRYNVLEKVADKMGLDTGNKSNLWKDKALVELNIAVLHSYQKRGVTIVDHHTASDQFMTHYENEKKLRGGCPADWVWIVPPMSGSLTSVYHQEMAVYQLKPSYDYQDKAWQEFKWDDEGYKPIVYNKVELKNNMKNAKEPTKAVKQEVKATILYATETGKSENFAKALTTKLSKSFNVQMCCMEDYDPTNIVNESLILVVTSTFGNGDPPENGTKFANKLCSIKMTGDVSKGTPELSRSFIRKNSSVRVKNGSINLNKLFANNKTPEYDNDPLKNTYFAVFGLGSSAYPNFCAFAYYVDNLLGDLGGNRLTTCGTGDELSGQDKSFSVWMEKISELATSTFANGAINIIPPIVAEKRMLDFVPEQNETTVNHNQTAFVQTESADDFILGLSTQHTNRKIQGYKLTQRRNLFTPKSGSCGTTINVTLQSWSHSPLEYEAGDHIGVYPTNSHEMVTLIINYLTGVPIPINSPVILQVKGPVPYNYPKCSIFELLSRYLDITTPPQASVLEYLLECTNDELEKDRLRRMIKDGDAYQRWKENYWPTLLSLLQQFPKAKPDAAILCSMLPKMQPRFYSISSSPLTRSDELELTIGVVSFQTQASSNSERYGVCSNFLKDVSIGTTIGIFVRRAPMFHLPQDKSVPVIMVGPGTGIAPFKGFCKELELKREQGGGRTIGEWTLYHGARQKHMILYDNEMTKLKKSTNKFKFQVALSREPGQKKMYVQDLLLADKKQISQKLMEEGAHIYVCGDCTMAEEVYQTVRNIISQCYNINEVKAENFMLSLRDENRYHEDVFGILHKTTVLKTNKLNLMERGHKEVKKMCWACMFCRPKSNCTCEYFD